MNLKRKRGFTLVELMVSAYILLIGICGILSLYVNTMLSAQTSWDTTVATSHAQYILEEMQKKDYLTDIEFTDWNQWIQEQHLTTLPNEKINVVFTSPGSDPLEIKIVNQWDRNLRTNSINICTKLTK